MNLQTRVYRCLPGRLAGAVEALRYITLNCGEATASAGRLLHHAGRRVQSREKFTYILRGNRSPTAKENGCVASDPEWLTAPRQNRGGRPDVGQHLNQLLVADFVLG